MNHIHAKNKINVTDENILEVKKVVRKFLMNAIIIKTEYELTLSDDLKELWLQDIIDSELEGIEEIEICD